MAHTVQNEAHQILHRGRWLMAHTVQNEAHQILHRGEMVDGTYSTE